MQISGNTILITGGGFRHWPGSGRGFHTEKNQVIIAGRRKKQLNETVAANPGMKAAVLDIENGEGIRSFADKFKKTSPP